ncbi:MAG: COX15/CtaA family protein [Dermatophilaceae bacterium]
MAAPVLRATWVRPILVANLVAQILIIVTGGVVRLTGSGLGCPDWPTCAEGSLTPVATQAEGIHKFIEFGNRTLTGVLVVIALLALWAVHTHYPRRRGMVRLAWFVLAVIAAQAVVGGITVWTGLNPVIVAFHFLASIVLVAAATALLRGADDGAEPAAREQVVHPWAVRLGWTAYAIGFAVMVLGTIVTGSGPHSGDAKAPARTGFDPRLVSWLHADVVMLFIGLALATLVAIRLGQTSGAPAEISRARHTWHMVLVITAIQGVLGYVQFFTGLPAVIVGTHMLGAALLAMALTNGTLNLYRNPV